MLRGVCYRPVSYQVVDFGCGDAQIARSVDNKVYSFDLVALNHYVRVCDITHVSILSLTLSWS